MQHIDAALLKKQISDRVAQARPEKIPGEIVAIVVPASIRGASEDLVSRVYRNLVGERYDAAIVINSGTAEIAGRIHICAGETYATPLGPVEIFDRIRQELCDEEDDIFVSDAGHFRDDGAIVQLPYLMEVLDRFRVVPVVMGDESPEFCRELGAAIGEVTYSQRSIVVAAVEVVSCTSETLLEFRKSLQECDIPRTMRIVQSESVKLRGAGPLLSTMIAASRRGADNIRIIDILSPEAGGSGGVGAIFWRGQG